MINHGDDQKVDDYAHSCRYVGNIVILIADFSAPSDPNRGVM